ncbi:MAG TPA: trehalose-phosphatase, partial [Candidatus Obscuribacterales bacterium]
GVRIGFFLHIPFPSSELFRQLPVRREILTGLLGADLIGFHDYAYLRHFCNSLLGILDLDSNMISLHWDSRHIRMGVFPVSIDVGHFMHTAAGPETAACLKHYDTDKAYRHLILGVDRLDYTKGLLQKLQIFKALLEHHPELQGQVSLLQIAIPTRQDVEEYQKLRAEFERMVGEINGAYSQPNYTPIQYMYASVSLHELLALYRLADVLLVTSLRDGMNLVALEYIVCQDLERPGMVVLSEFTGAASMLSSVPIINPWDASGAAESVHAALMMPLPERRQRIATMQDFLRGYTASDWAAAFMEELAEDMTHTAPRLRQREILIHDPSFMSGFLRQIQPPLLLFLDYDGTLVPIEAEPGLAVLPASSFALLERLTRRKDLDLVVISGRDADFISRQFQQLPLSLAAEHGAKLYDHHRREWVNLIWTAIDAWYPSAEKIMRDYSRRVPDSLIERKEFSIAWHYRRSPDKFARYQARKLKEELETGLSNLPVSILSGDKVIEARAVEAHKGYFIRNYLESYLSEHPAPTIMAIGD